MPRPPKARSLLHILRASRWTFNGGDLSREQIKWVQDYMRPLKEQGLIEPEEERHQWVFHVMVSGRYTDWRESMMLAGEQPIPQASETAELPLQ